MLTIIKVVLIRYRDVHHPENEKEQDEKIKSNGVKQNKKKDKKLKNFENAEKVIASWKNIKKVTYS